MSCFTAYSATIIPSIFHRLLQRQTRKMLVGEHFSLILNLLHESIWPQFSIHEIAGRVHLEERSQGLRSSPSPKKLERLLIKFCEKNTILLKYFLNDPNILMPFIVSKLQNHEFNKFLIYDLLDVVYQEVKLSKIN